jgi:methylenetetrahydrofolate dehydrogenase (NADP+)/methenyltetrahydrofolate cyclohydrolase
MTAQVIDGKAQAASIRATLAAEIAGTGGKRPPGLAVVLVGDDPASAIYVRNKIRACMEAGVASFEHRLDAAVTEAELLRLIGHLNADNAVDGILVQLPLSKHIDTSRVLQAVDPDKDVDGFHPLNAGRLFAGLPGFVPCTPLGCLKLIRSVRPDLSGARALMLGRSLTVGKPMALLLDRADATITLAHAHTRDVPRLCAEADILVAAIGCPEFIRGDWIKPGAIVIDVGINRREDGSICGDVEFAAARAVAAAITPVPGGVGPMTIACLLSNTWDSYKAKTGCT